MTKGNKKVCLIIFRQTPVKRKIDYEYLPLSSMEIIRMIQQVVVVP